MFVAALLLLLIAVLLVIAAIFGGGGTATLDLGAFNLEADARTMFFLGMGTLLLIVLGLGLLRSGTRRASARRHDRRKVGELSRKLDDYRSGEREHVDHDDHTGHRDRDHDVVDDTRRAD